MEPITKLIAAILLLGLLFGVPIMIGTAAAENGPAWVGPTLAVVIFAFIGAVVEAVKK